ncbi:MAG: hypothetical protein Q8L80_10495 [Gallionella sp.]|nr:hypothetical protein [Gallionella sp.]MDP1939295.1 hypothetical protein [Gallionella sp.]
MEFSEHSAGISAHPFSTTEQLLVSGGDARIALDAHSGLNKYGCRPYPDPQMLALGSSTASVISTASFAAAGQLRDRLLHELGDEPIEALYAREMQRIKMALLCDLTDMDIELVFATSGTDAHFVAARHVANASDTPLRVVMVEEAETGSGVAAALAGQNLSAGTDFSEAIEVCSVPLRAADGTTRPAEHIDADVAVLVNEAVAQGGRVLLVMVDQSKTGLIAPSPACVAGLRHRHPQCVDILVDACQFRIAPPTLRAYLQQGFMVALTGSKFFTGPSFSGALLFSASMGKRLKLRTGDDSSAANFGLLLRWEAALVELRRFRAVPESVVVGFMRAFEQAVQQRLMNDSRFEPLEVPSLKREPFTTQQSWDHIQSIFPFVLYRPRTAAGRIPLNRDQMLQIYRQLPMDVDGAVSLRCQLGQPVACGTREGVPVSALRLCISARLIGDAYEEKGIDGVIDEAWAALDKIAWLLDRLND